MTRPQFRLLGALLTAVGLMALFASLAQAEFDAKFLFLKTEGGALETVAEMEAETLTGKPENKTGSLLATILGIGLNLLCTDGELKNAHPGPEGSVKKGASIKFTGCVALEQGTGNKLANCNPHSAGQAVGSIETKPFHNLVLLHKLANVEKHDTMFGLPDNETTKEFTNVEMGVGCAIGENVPVRGAFSVSDCVSNAEWLKHKAVHLFTEFKPLNTLKAAGQAATIDGTWEIKAESGRAWTVDPG